MDIHINNNLKPEDALSRFMQPQPGATNNQESSFTEPVSRYGFVIGSTGFLITQDTLSEIVRDAKIYPVPNTKNWMRGLINLRGNLVPVYDLSLLLGYSKKPSSYTNLLVLSKNNLLVGILIEKLPKSCDIHQWKKITHLPIHLSGFEKYVTETYSSEEMIWIEFNQNGYFESIKEQVGI